MNPLVGTRGPHRQDLALRACTWSMDWARSPEGDLLVSAAGEMIADPLRGRA